MKNIAILMFIIYLSLSSMMIYIGIQLKDITEDVDMMSGMFEYMNRYDRFKGERGNVKLTGLAISDDYYCVWTDDQTVEEINETVNHEKLHIMIYKERGHFCHE